MSKRIITHYEGWELTSYKEIKEYLYLVSEGKSIIAPLLNIGDKRAGEIGIYETDNTIIQTVLLDKDGSLTTHVSGENPFIVITDASELERVVRGTEILF